METFSTRWFMNIYSRLFLYYGDPQWWPGETPFEVCIGAVLTQNTSWTNVEKAIRNLKELDLLGPEELSGADIEQIASVIRPAGYFNQKAGYLKSISSFITEELGGDIRALSYIPMNTAREKLLSVKGIGKETADSILCYAVNLPIFVVDAYTGRIFMRLDPEFGSGNSGPKGPGYDDVQDMVMIGIRGDTLLYNRFHAILVILAKDHCRTAPKCENCPLRCLCVTGKDLMIDRRQNEK